MKHILLIIIAILTLCISCKGKGSVSVSSDTRHDSIVAIDGNRSFEFLKKLGIEYESLIAKMILCRHHLTVIFSSPPMSSVHC